MSIEPPPLPRKPKDRDFIETPEGFLFCLVGYLHPDDKYIAYLKYSPAEQGLWKRQEQAYHRQLAYYHAHQVGQTMDFLKEHYPHYVHHSQVWDMDFSMVSHDRVKTYFYPERRLAQILAHPADPLEEETVKVVEAIQRLTGIRSLDLGITGSILLGIHNPEISDIDLIVFGRHNASRLREVFSSMALPGLSPMDAAYADEWCQGVVKNFGLRYHQARWLIARRWNFVYFGAGRHVVSIHPTRSDDEIDEAYGDHQYQDVGVAYLRARIADARDAIFLPAVYAVDQIEILEGPPVEIVEICSYEGLFGQIGESGDWIMARGKLEKIDGGPKHRLVIGSGRREGQEFLLPANL
jgi:predicted nucleotidyltransferase